MSVYLVTWDLNEENTVRYNQKRNVLTGLLGKVGAVKDSGLDSVVFVPTESSPSELYEYLVQGNYLDKNDRIIIVRITRGNYFGWLDSSMWDWISSRV